MEADIEQTTRFFADVDKRWGSKSVLKAEDMAKKQRTIEECSKGYW